MNFLNKIYGIFIKIPRTYYGLEKELDKYEKINNRNNFHEYKYTRLRQRYVSIYWNNVFNNKCDCNWK